MFVDFFGCIYIRLRTYFLITNTLSVNLKYNVDFFSENYCKLFCLSGIYAFYMSSNFAYYHILYLSHFSESFSNHVHMIAFHLQLFFPYSINVILLMVTCYVEQRHEEHILVLDALQLLLHIIYRREALYRADVP